MFRDILDTATDASKRKAYFFRGTAFSAFGLFITFSLRGEIVSWIGLMGGIALATGIGWLIRAGRQRKCEAQQDESLKP